MSPCVPCSPHNQLSFCNQQQSHSNSHPSFKRAVPISLQEFLRKLDNEFGAGEYMQYLDILSSHKINVMNIKYLNDEQFHQLGIDLIGHRITLKQTAAEY